MAKDAVTPSLITIIFILFTGLYGFVKFTYEKGHINTAYVNTISTPPPPPMPIPADHGGTGLNKPIKPLFTYVYTESPNARVNLIFFLGNGLHGAADFIFILNGPTDAGDLIPNKTNIRVFSRSAKCSDQTAHGEVLRKDELWKKYGRFIMLNSAVRGPFMPLWSRSCWSDVFLNRITKDVKLVGIKAACLPKFHIESMIWATDTIGMELLLDPPKGSSVPNTLDEHRNQVVASGDHFNRMKQVTSSEVEAPRAIKAAGYRVDVLITPFPNIEDHEDNCATDSVEDAVPNRHGNIHPYETVFVRTSRDTDSVTVDRLTKWHQSRLMNGSWDVCP